MEIEKKAKENLEKIEKEIDEVEKAVNGARGIEIEKHKDLIARLNRLYQERMEYHIFFKVLEELKK